MEFKPVATGFCLIEAPTMRGEDLWFSDLMLGGLRRLSPDGKIEAYLTDRKHIGGLALNEDGRLVCSGPGGLIWFEPETGATGDLLSEIDGEPLPGINDMLPDGNGGLYFGTLRGGGDYEEGIQPAKLGHLAAGRTAKVLDGEVAFGNGLGLSPNGKLLYHNESTVATYAYDVADDGSLSNKRVFVDREDPDGLAMDAEGGVWIAHYDSGEIARYLPEGTLERRASLPHNNVISLCFGGADLRDLYVTTAGDDGIGALMRGEMPEQEAAVFHARSDIAGMPVPPTRFALP